MADVTTYSRCIASYAKGAVVCTAGEIRSASDPIVTANPQFWVALTDAEMASSKKHQN